MNGTGSPREETIEQANGCTETVLRAPSTHENVELLMGRICRLASDLPLSKAARYRLEFAVHEALTNAVVHGNKNDPRKQVTATCRPEPDQLAVIIEDEGNGFDPDSVPDPTSETNVLKESGRGVFLMRAYADECRHEDGGRRVVIVKRFDLPHPEPCSRG